MRRYESYKDSGVEWLGEVPSHWNVVSMKRVIKEHSGNGFPIDLQGNNGNIPFLKVSDFSENPDKYILKWNNSVTRKITKQKKWNIVPKNCIVTAKIGEALRKNHRKILLQDSIIDNNCLGIEVKQADILFGYYLHCALDFDLFTNPGAIPSLSMEKYRNQKIALPPFQEQQKIAQFLDDKTAKIDQAMDLAEKQIALLKEHKQILIQNAVTRGLNPDVPLKDSSVEWIGQVPEHWEVKKLKFVLTLSNKKEESKNSNKRYIGMENIESFTGKINDIPLIAEGIANSFYKDEILFGKLRPYLAKSYLADFDGICSTEFLVYRSTKVLNNRFALNIFLSYGFIDAVNASTYGSKMPRANAEFISNMFLAIPPLSKQKQIIDYLDTQTAKIDQAIALKTAHIEKLKEYKSVLINDVVTGKVRV